MKKRLGKGYYNKVALVAPKIVAKFFPEVVSKKEARQVNTLHRNYIDLLKRAGINVAETEFSIKNLADKKARIRILQEAFEKGEITKNKLRKCSKAEALQIAELILGETLKVFNFNTQVAMPEYGVIVGADFKPDNVVISNGKLIYIDTFSPHIRGVKDPSKLHPVFERYFDKQGRLLSWITKKYLTETIYNQRKRMVTLVSLLARARPKLKKEFLTMARKMVREQLPREQATEIIQGLHSGSIAVSRIIGKGVRVLGKRKGKNIQV